MQMLIAPARQFFKALLCLPTAPTLPIEGKGDFGTSLSGQCSGKSRLPFVLDGNRRPKAQGRMAHLI
jgi:hypothetical protein